jgi:hypothetical protein
LLFSVGKVKISVTLFLENVTLVFVCTYLMVSSQYM